ETISCASPPPSEPETTAARIAATLPMAQRRRSGPGATTLERTLLPQPPAQVVERARARHVRDLVEVVRRRRRGRVPLERVREPGVVADACPDSRRADDVDDEDEHAERHHERADRRSQVVRLPEPVVVIGIDA